MRRHRITAAVAALALVVGGATACRDSRTAATGGTPKITIMVGGLEKVIYLPAMLTQQLGGFSREGLDVELQSDESGAGAETALVAGQVQAVVGFYDHTIDLQAKNQCITSVVQLANIPGEAEVVSAANADKIRSAADFRGRKLGVTSLGSSTDFLTRALAARAGIGADAFTPVKVGAGQTFIASLDNGGIDAGMTTDPTIASLVDSGQGKVVYDLRTVEGTRAALGGLYPASSLYLDCDFVQRNHDVVQKLADAFVDTLRWISQHTPEEIAAKMPQSYNGGNEALYIESIKDSIGMFNADGRMDPDGARNALNVLSGFSTSVRPRKDSIDLSKTYTTQFVDAVPKQN